MATSTTKEKNIITGETAGTKVQRHYKALCGGELQPFEMVAMQMDMGSQRKLTRGVLNSRSPKGM